MATSPCLLLLLFAGVLEGYARLLQLAFVVARDILVADGEVVLVALRKAIRSIRTVRLTDSLLGNLLAIIDSNCQSGNIFFLH